MKWSLSLWLLTIALFVAYVVADAAFDASQKISAFVRLRALPVIRGAWGAVVGAAKPAAPMVAMVNNSPISPDNGHYVSVTISGVLAFLWKWRAPFLFLAGFVIVVSLMRGCSFPNFGKSAGHIALERDLAEAEVKIQGAINARDAEIADVARDVALMRQQLQSLSQRGRDEIAAAAPDDEAPIDPELVAAWRRALDGLCVVRADGSFASTCGSSA